MCIIITPSSNPKISRWCCIWTLDTSPSSSWC